MSDDMNDRFVEAVKEKISDFNQNRGNRKELAPEIVEPMERPYREFGREVDISTPLKEYDAVPRMAHGAVRTLLRLKPRPDRIALVTFPGQELGYYCFGVKVPPLLKE